MKVISFKVSENDYQLFKQFVKERHANFTKCLQPIIHDIVSKQKQPNEYTKYTFKKNDTLCQDLVLVKEIVEKMIIKYKKKEVNNMELKKIPIKKIKGQVTPDTGWKEPSQIGQICLKCGLKILQNPPITEGFKTCPRCGFDMTKIEKIGLIMLEGKAYIMTNPN